MQHEVDAEIAWMLVDGRGKGVVRQRGDVTASGEFGDCHEVGQGEGRVGRRFQHNQFGIFARRGKESGGVALVYQGDFHAHARQQIGEQFRGAHIVRGLRDDVVARPHMGKQGGAHRAHAGRHQQCRFRAFQSGEQAFAAFLRRIAVAGVIARVTRLVRHFRKLGGIAGAVGRGGINRGGERRVVGFGIVPIQIAVDDQ